MKSIFGGYVLLKFLRLKYNFFINNWLANFPNFYDFCWYFEKCPARMLKLPGNISPKDGVFCDFLHINFGSVFRIRNPS